MTDIELALIEYDGDGSKPYCDVVYEALKKQLPKKVNWESGLPRCPKCGCRVGVSDSPNYCLYCGQALK